MADGVAITAGAGTTIATDDIGSVHYQRVKVNWGADGSTVDASAADPLPVQIVGENANGLTVYTLSSAATTNGNNIKSSAGTVYHIFATNSNSSPRYLRLYNSASAPTVGTTATYWQAMIPGGAGLAVNIPQGLAFSTGIGVSLTTGAANTDTGAVALDEVKLNIGYV